GVDRCLASCVLSATGGQYMAEDHLVHGLGRNGMPFQQLADQLTAQLDSREAGKHAVEHADRTACRADDVDVLHTPSGSERSFQRFTRFAIHWSTTAGSASVVVSPMFSSSLAAILRRMRRMILPERVLGRPGANWMISGRAKGPISWRTQSTNSLRSASSGSAPPIRVT